MPHAWEMVSDVLLRLSQVGQHNINANEILGWIDQGCRDTGNLLYDLDRQWYVGIKSIATKQGVTNYSLPADILKLDRVAYDATNAYGGDTTKYPQAKIWPIRDIGAISGPDAISAYSPQGGQPLASRPFVVIVGRNIYPLPIPSVNVTVGMQLTYTREVNRLSLAKRGVGIATTSDGAADGSTLVSSTLALPDRTECVISLNTGTSAYERNLISAFDVTTGTCTMQNPFTTKIVTGVTFDINDQTIIPEQFHHIPVFYATAMAALKAGNVEFATKMMTAYDQRLDKLRASRKDTMTVKSHDAEPFSAEVA